MSYPRFTQLIIRVWFQSWPFRCKMHPTNRSKICQDMLFSLISALLHVVRNTKKPLNTVLSVRCGHESPQLSLINNPMMMMTTVCQCHAAVKRGLQSQAMTKEGPPTRPSNTNHQTINGARLQTSSKFVHMPFFQDRRTRRRITYWTR